MGSKSAKIGLDFRPSRFSSTMVSKRSNIRKSKTSAWSTTDETALPFEAHTLPYSSPNFYIEGKSAKFSQIWIWGDLIPNWINVSETRRGPWRFYVLSKLGIFRFPISEKLCSFSTLPPEICAGKCVETPTSCSCLAPKVYQRLGPIGGAWNSTQISRIPLP